MNRLPITKSVQILHSLVEGNSLRSASRLADVSINTVYKLLVDSGEACAAYHDEHVRGVADRRVQFYEIWSFVYAKAKNVSAAKRKDLAYGDAWTWIAIDADTKLVLSYLVGGRDADYALALLDDLRQRVTTRMQLTTDGH